MFGSISRPIGHNAKERREPALLGNLNARVAVSVEPFSGVPSSHREESFPDLLWCFNCCLAEPAGRDAAGNCRTRARWPSHRRVSKTTCPSENSNAS